MDKNIKQNLRQNQNSRINRELITLKKMIYIYCTSNHNASRLCSNCFSLQEYAKQQLLKCPLYRNKPVCENCNIHCYKKSFQDEIKKVMRYSGRKMIYHHPIRLIRHFIDKYTYEN